MTNRFSHGYALLVGVGQSAYPAWSRPAAAGDVRAIHGALVAPQGCAYLDDEQHIHLLVDAQATRAAILAGLAWLYERAAADPAATALFYCSTHGFLESATGQYYLLPHDVRPFAVPTSALAIRELAAALQQIPTRRLLVLLDTSPAGDPASTLDFPPGLAPTALPAGLLEACGPGRAVLTSARGEQRSWTLPDGSASLFAHHLAEAFQGAGASPGETAVYASQVGTYLSWAVPRSARQLLQAEQTPSFAAAGQDFAVGLLRGGQGLPPVAAPAAGESLIAEAGGAHSAAISGDVTESIIATGEHALVQQGQYNVGQVYGDVTIIESAPQVPPAPEPDRPPAIQDFVGREAELAGYAAQLADTHLAVIVGMAGVGKTALAAALVQRVGEPGRCFWHAFHADEGVEVILMEMASFLAWTGQDDLWRTLQLARQSGGPLSPVEVRWDYLFQMLRGSGHLLCLDDWHHVEDDPLLTTMAERLLEAAQAGDISLIVTSRKMPAWVPAECVPLAGLGAADVRQLLAHHELALPEETQAALYERTEGNPQLLVLAIDALHGDDDPAGFVARLNEAERIENYLLTEVDEGLTEDEHEVLGGVSALLGYAGTRDAIETIVDRRGTRRLLGDLARRHLLTVRETAAGREYGMHAMIQSFYYDLLDRPRRLDLHRRAGNYYETAEPQPLRAALHLERAGESARAARLATADVRALINQGQAVALRRLLERFAARQLDPLLWAAVLVARGQLEALQGDGRQSQESFLAAREQLASQPDTAAVRELRARACQGMGEALEYETLREALDWFTRGLDELGPSNPLLAAELHMKSGSALIALGDRPAALAALERGLALLPAGPSYWRAAAMLNQGIIYCAQGDVARGNEVTLCGLEIAQQLHEDWLELKARHNIGVEIEYRGDWAGAEEHYRQALVLAERLGSKFHQAALPLALGILETKRGHGELAQGHLAACLELARRHNLVEFLVAGLSSLADLRLRQGDPAAAAPLLAEAEQRAVELDSQYQRPEIYRLQAELHLLQGWSPAALEYARRSVALAHELGEPREEGCSQRVLGQALWASGRPEEALAAWAEGLRLLESCDPYEAARLRAQWGRALQAGPEAERGRELLAAAAAVFRRLGVEGDGA